jgi:hypothetical protein
MRKGIVIALLLFLLGVIQLTDWILFSTREENKNLAIMNLNSRYLERFSPVLQSYFRNPIISTLACMLFFATASVLFFREKKKIFWILGIISFILAFWQLFSLM